MEILKNKTTTAILVALLSFICIGSSIETTQATATTGASASSFFFPKPRPKKKCKKLYVKAINAWNKSVEATTATDQRRYRLKSQRLFKRFKRNKCDRFF